MDRDVDNKLIDGQYTASDTGFGDTKLTSQGTPLGPGDKKLAGSSNTGNIDDAPLVVDSEGVIGDRTHTWPRD